MSSTNSADDDGVLFECSACHEEPCAPRLGDLSAWARLCGYDTRCIHLCQEMNERALETIQINPRLIADHQFFDFAPEAGKSYIACVSHPFIAKPGEPFWFLHLPPFTLHNGWEENPEEIYSSRLVHGVFDRVLHRAKEFALIAVTVQEMLSVSAIHELFPETTDARVFAMFDDDFDRRAAWVRWLNYVYVYWNLESDVGVWWLFRQEELLATPPQFRLVLQGHWGWHDALVWAGNQRLSEADAAHLHSFMLR
jgi:hypothetical protein